MMGIKSHASSKFSVKKVPTRAADFGRVLFPKALPPLLPLLFLANFLSGLNELQITQKVDMH